MKFEFKDVINKHQNDRVFVLGLGPSLRKQLEKYQKLSVEDGNIFISANRSDILIPEIELDYWMISNPVMTVETLHREINARSKTVLVYAESVDLTPRNFVSTKLKNTYLPFDQRHFNGQRCNACSAYKCDSHLIPFRKTIQEELRDYCKVNYHYGTGSTCGLHMLALAIITGSKEIFISGIDLSYDNPQTGPYVRNGIHTPFLPDQNGGINPHMEEILNDFKTIRDSAANIGVKIFTENEVKISSIFGRKES